MISGKDIDILRAIPRSGYHYDSIKRLLSETDWRISEDEKDLGYLRIDIPAELSGEYYTLVICYRDSEHGQHCLLTFACFPDSESHIGAFDALFLSVAQAVVRHLGEPAVCGEHRFPFRAWPYSYRRWSLPEAEYTLVQDEFDIQSGMDVTLWIQPVGTTIRQTPNL